MSRQKWDGLLSQLFRSFQIVMKFECALDSKQNAIPMRNLTLSEQNTYLEIAIRANQNLDQDEDRVQWLLPESAWHCVK